MFRFVQMDKILNYLFTSKTHFWKQQQKYLKKWTQKDKIEVSPKGLDQRSGVNHV